MRGSTSGVWRCVFQVVLATLFAITPASSRAAIFDDGNDRHLVKDLRAKDPVSLAAEEKAILAAANKVGNIGLCNGKISANAFVIRFNGRPAVVTSAHAIVETGSSSFAIKCPSLEELENAFYMPNTSYYDTLHPNRSKDFVFRKVGVEVPPVNWDDLKHGASEEKDFAIFYLHEDIVQDRMPDGSRRGHLAFGKAEPSKGSIYMLGLAPDLGAGVEMLYQQRCDGFDGYGVLYTSCDTIKGASGSLVATFESDELRFRGLLTSGLGQYVLTLPSPDELYKLNTATYSDGVKELSDAAGSPWSPLRNRPTFLASDLQWLLTRAGCYSGKLDNRWGPASRNALAAFAAAAEIELPGTEPSPELLAAVEKTAPEGAGMCRR